MDYGLLRLEVGKDRALGRLLAAGSTGEGRWEMTLGKAPEKGGVEGSLRPPRSSPGKGQARADRTHCSAMMYSPGRGVQGTPATCT